MRLSRRCVSLLHWGVDWVCFEKPPIFTAPPFLPPPLPQAPALIAADEGNRGPALQVLAGALTHVGTSAAGGARAGGGGGAGADALSDAAFSALGLDALSAGVATAGNIVDAALRLGVDAVAAGADAAAVAHKLLCFGPAAAGLEDPSIFSDSPIFLESTGVFPGHNSDGDDASGGGMDANGALAVQPSIASSARTARENAQAQLRRAQSVLSALTAGGPASVRGETAAAAAVLEALATEELRAAGAASVVRRKTAPYAGGCV